MGSAQGVPGTRPTVISGVVLGVALAWWVSGCVAPVVVWGIPTGLSSRVPVCRGVMRTAVVMGYRVRCMPLVVTGASVALGSMAWSWPVKAVPLAASVMEGVWPVPVAMLQVGARSIMMMGCPSWGSLGWNDQNDHSCSTVPVGSGDQYDLSCCRQNNYHCWT